MFFYLRLSSNVVVMHRYPSTPGIRVILFVEYSDKMICLPMPHTWGNPTLSFPSWELGQSCLQFVWIPLTLQLYSKFLLLPISWFLPMVSSPGVTIFSVPLPPQVGHYSRYIVRSTMTQGCTYNRVILEVSGEHKEDISWILNITARLLVHSFN